MAISEYIRAPASSLGARVRLPVITVELGLYILLGLVALTLRFLALDSAPLSSEEAAQALAAWNWLNANPSQWTGSPLLFAFDGLVFLLGGAHDAAVRLLPAIAGSAVVLFPIMLRRELGHVGALVASAIMALSPSLVLFSRVGSGTMAAVCFAFAAVLFAWRYQSDQTAWYLYLAPVSAALALLASSEVWTVVLALGIYAALQLRRARSTLSQGPEVLGSDRAGIRTARVWLRTVAIGVLVFVGIGSLFMTHREGIGAAIDLLGLWLQGLAPGGSPMDLLRVLVIYEPLVFFLGVTAVIDALLALGTNHKLAPPVLVMTIWALTAFVLYSIGVDNNPVRIVVVIVPLAVLAGKYIGEWAERLSTEYAEESDAAEVILSQELPVFLFGCVLAAFLYLVLVEFTTRGSVLAGDLLAAMIKTPADARLNAIVLTALIAIAFAAVAFLAVTTVGWMRSRNVMVAISLVLLTLWGIRQMALVNFGGQWNPQEWLVSRATSPNVRDLVTDIKDISRWRARDSHTLLLLADDSLGPVVKWYLRDFRNAKFEARPVMIPGVHALLLSPNTPVNQANLMSQRYRIESTSAGSPPSFMQWLFFRQYGRTVESEAVLWIPIPQP